MMFMLIMCTGCRSKETAMEDYVRSNPVSVFMNAIMKSDTGYYYCTGVGREMSLHYYDIKSGQNIFLCSKPECRHDGDAFCTATSGKYIVDNTCMYGGELYLNVVETTDTEYLYKLLKVSGDGTQLTELVTYMTINKTSLVPVMGNEIIMHRGCVAMSYWLANTDNSEVGMNGMFFYNLVDGKLTQLPEIDINKGKRWRISGCGDYIYYNTTEGHKNRVSRYSLKDGSIEKMEFLISYNGMYEVWDEDTIYYTRSGSSLYEYKISTKENKEHRDFSVNRVTYHNEWGDYESKQEYILSDMVTDGTYLYTTEEANFHNISLEAKKRFIGTPDIVEQMKSYVRVYNANLQEIAKVEIVTEKYLGYTDFFSLAILDGTVYLQTPEKVFACSVEDFITAAEPPFCEVYSNEIDIPSVRNWK